MNKGLSAGKLTHRLDGERVEVAAVFPVVLAPIAQLN
jgi:hypothetical protein